MTTAALVLALCNLGHPCITPADQVRAHHLAAAINRAARAFDVDPVLQAAVIARESGFNARARGAAGELGLQQLLRGTLATAGYEHLTDEALMQLPINTWLGARFLAHVRAACARKGITDPLAWVSQYKGLPARPSRYSRAIIKAADRARETAREADGPGTMIARVGRGHAVGVCTAPARAQKVAAQ